MAVVYLVMELKYNECQQCLLCLGSCDRLWLAWACRGGKAVQFGCFLSLGAGNARMVVTVRHSIFSHFRSYMISFVHFYRTRVRSLFTLVTDSLTNSCLANLIDVTLACEDTNTKLVDVVTVTDEDPVGNNLLQISKLRFGKKAKLLFIL